LKTLLENIAKLQSGLYAQPDIQADTLYLQGVHFDQFGEFNRDVKPQLKLDDKIERHLLQHNDILFAAKGLNNFAVVYHTDLGKAVASSSFIIVRLNHNYRQQVQPNYLAWYLTNNPGVKLFHKQLGTTIPSISIEKLSKLEIDIPSLEQQQRIVQIQELRNREKQLVKQLEIHKDFSIKHQLLTAAKQ
jgi:restriction endonuclease S subunit